MWAVPSGMPDDYGCQDLGCQGCHPFYLAQERMRVRQVLEELLNIAPTRVELHGLRDQLAEHVREH